MSVQKGQFKIPDGNGGVKVCQFETSADMVEGLDEIDSFQTKYNTLSEKIDEMKTAMLDSIAEVEHNSQVRYQTVLQQIESAESGISETGQSRYAALAARVSELEDKIDEAGIIVAQTRYTVPTIADVFTYNGQVQTPVLQNFRENIMTIMTDSSVTSATNAGEYAITVRLADGKMWEGDTTEDKIIGWAIGKAVATVPTIEENNFTYDGTAKRPTIKNFRENIMTIVTDSSVTSATNAGEYSIEIQLDDPDNYTWADGTTENKTLAWQVAKAASILSLSANSGSVDYSGTSTFRVASQTGDGALSVTSANTNCVTATISDATITLSGVQANSDATVITVTKAETQNYTGATATYNCVVNKIAGSIKIVTNTGNIGGYGGTAPAYYDSDTNTLTLNDDTWRAIITLEREGDGEVENWEYYGGADFISQIAGVNGKQVSFRIAGIDITPGWGQQPTKAQATRQIICKEGTNHKAASVSINLISTARARIRYQSVRCTGGIFTYNGNEQSVANLNDTDIWTYDVTEALKQLNDKDLNQFFVPYSGLPDLNDFLEITSGSSATNVGTYQAWLNIKNTTRFRWQSDPTGSLGGVAAWQWKINKYYLTADCSESNDVLGGSANAPTSLTVPVKDVYNDDCYIVSVTGVRNHISESDFTIESGRPYEFDGKGEDSWNNTTTLNWKFYPQFTAANQSRTITIRLTDSAATNYICGGNNHYFKFTFTSGTFHT